MSCTEVKARELAVVTTKTGHIGKIQLQCPCSWGQHTCMSLNGLGRSAAMGVRTSCVDEKKTKNNTLTGEWPSFFSRSPAILCTV